MRNLYALLICFLGCISQITAQNIGINSTGATPNAAAMLDIVASDKGMLIPRVNLTSTLDITTIPSPVNSLLVYNQNAAGVVPNNVVAGFYYWNGTSWTRLLNGNTAPYWSVTGNAGTNPTTNFIGTTDGQPFKFRVGNTAAGGLFFNGSTYFGLGAGTANTNLGINTAIGYNALSTGTGSQFNTAVGANSQISSEGWYNTSLGHNALQSNIASSNNVAIGYNAMQFNTTGTNVGIGSQALQNNTTGNSNTAIGTSAMSAAINAGNQNVAVGASALLNNQANNNTGVGYYALSRQWYRD
jgi:hypothetical protein